MLVIRIRVTRPLARAPLHEQRVPAPAQLKDTRRDKSHPVLLLFDFLGNPDDHRLCSTLCQFSDGSSGAEASRRNHGPKLFMMEGQISLHFSRSRISRSGFCTTHAFCASSASIWPLLQPE